MANTINNTLDNYITVDPSATDAGEDTQSNYRFQNLCTSLIALDMYNGATEYNELFCELYEDVTAAKQNGAFVGIQIKHKINGNYSLTNKQYRKTIHRFLMHEKTYPQKFDKFIIMSNASVTAGKYKLTDLSQYCQNRNEQKVPEFENVLTAICAQTDFDSNDAAIVLAKTESEKIPNKKHIVDHIANNYTATIPECNDKNVFQLKALVNQIADMVYKKSTTIDDSLNRYFSFMSNGGLQRDHALINHKRITSDDIKVIINENKKIIPIQSDTDWPKKLGSLDLIDKKMALGGINASAIKSMRTLAISTFGYFFKAQYKSKLKDTHLDRDKLRHIIGILDEQCAQAETKARQKKGPFGSKKLMIIDKKLDKLTRDRSHDIFKLAPETLKGFVGLRVADCTVNFSDKPKEGFI